MAIHAKNKVRIKCAICTHATCICFIVTIYAHTKQMQAARILYARVQFVHILHMCTLHVCCVECNICAAHILQLSIFVRDRLDCTEVSFNPENGAFSQNQKVTHRVTDKVTTITRMRMHAEGNYSPF